MNEVTADDTNKWDDKENDNYDPYYPIKIENQPEQLQFPEPNPQSSRKLLNDKNIP